MIKKTKQETMEEIGGKNIKHLNRLRDGASISDDVAEDDACSAYVFFNETKKYSPSEFLSIIERCEKILITGG